MASRATWMLAVGLAAVAMVGCPRTETPKPPERASASKQAEPRKPNRQDGVVGYYVLDDPVFYGATDMNAAPPGQVMYLGIESGRWMMRNMLVGYGGTWIGGQAGATLTVNEGPTGNTAGKEKLAVKRIATGVTLSVIGSKDPEMRFRYVGAAAPKEFGYDEFLGPKK